MCEVTGARRNSADWAQGGLDIPCRLHFTGDSRLITKVQRLLQETHVSGLLSSCEQESSHEPPEKKSRIELDVPDLLQAPWLHMDGLVLSQLEKELLRDGKWLNDKHINFAQALLKKQFPSIDGWKLTLQQEKAETKLSRACGYTQR